jgi:hypothetical protein
MQESFIGFRVYKTSKALTLSKLANVATSKWIHHQQNIKPTKM